MPEPYKGNRGVAQSYIPELVSEGFTNSQIVDFLQLNGVSYRTQNMYADINRLRLENFGALALPNLDPAEAIPEKLMRQWTGDTSYNYRVVIKYDYFNTSTLQKEEGGTTLYFEDAPSQDEVFDAWDIRKQTLQAGVGSGQNIQEVFGATKFLYYRNVRGS